MNRKRIAALLPAAGLLILLLLAGCEVVSDAVLGGASRGAQQAVSKRVEQAVYKRMAPRGELPPPGNPNWGQYMAFQAQVVFSYSFSAGGFWLGQVGYAPGDTTTFDWQATGEDSVIMEKAFLKKLPDGKEWWRVSWTQGQDNWVYEALMDTEGGQLLRLRARDADGNEGEVPVTGETIYIPPTEPTPESIAGATVGTESVKTPAGTFQADHIVYLSTGGEGQIEFWTTDKVPGGVVQYLLSDKQEGVIWSSILTEYGSNATTMLGSF
jgi:hypothetical protein